MFNNDIVCTIRTNPINEYNHIEHFTTLVELQNKQENLPISEVESFFYTITMVNININIQNTSMIFKKLQDP